MVKITENTKSPGRNTFFLANIIIHFLMLKITIVLITMYFRPRETPFFCDNFLTLELIGFNFRHEPFQLKRQFLSIWFVNEKSKFGLLVVGP